METQTVAPLFSAGIDQSVRFGVEIWSRSNRLGRRGW
jgi:hypothetical protein